MNKTQLNAIPLAKDSDMTEVRDNRGKVRVVKNETFLRDLTKKELDQLKLDHYDLLEESRKLNARFATIQAKWKAAIKAKDTAAAALMENIEAGTEEVTEEAYMVFDFAKLECDIYDPKKCKIIRTEKIDPQIPIVENDFLGQEAPEFAETKDAFTGAPQGLPGDLPEDLPEDLERAKDDDTDGETYEGENQNQDEEE